MSSGSKNLVGKSAQVKTDFGGSFVAFCGVLRFTSEVDRSFVAQFLNSRIYKDQILGVAKGIGINNLQKGSIEGVRLPLPPLAEQHRIVAKVDQLMALCDEMEKRQEKKRRVSIQVNESALNKLTTATTPEMLSESWERIKANFDLLYDRSENVEKLKQTILQLAVQGKLVPQDAKDEPASGLLDKIMAEKQRLITEKKLKPSEVLPPISPAEVPFELPNGWAWCRLEDLAERVEYGTSEKSSLLRTGVPVVRMGDIQNGRVLLENLKSVPKSIDDLPRLFLKRNDVLFNRTNSAELVGKTGIFRGENSRYTFASYLIRLSFFQPYTSPEYVNISMNAPYYRKTQIEPELTQQCGQANFNGTKLKESLIPLPPLDEQYRIVAKADRLIIICNGMQSKLHHTGSAAERLMDAVVAGV